jgi:hypothetical protein
MGRSQLPQEVGLAQDPLTQFRDEDLDRMRRFRIPHGADLPVKLILREYDFVHGESFCNPSFARCAAMEGTGVRGQPS